MSGMLWHKALIDVLRRPIRSILVILGLMIGIFGLTAIDVADGQIASAFRYSADQTSAANITFSVDQLPANLQATVAALPNVAAAQFAQEIQSRWQITATPGHANIQLWAYPDLAHVAVSPFQITSGHLPGPGEIVMESSDGALQPVHLGDQVTLSTPTGPQTLRIVGLARTLGSTSASVTNVALGYISLDEATALSGKSGMNTVLVSIHDASQITTTVVALRNLLVANGLTVVGESWVRDPFSTGPLDGIFVVMRVLAGIALLLSAFLIINTITTLLVEQTRMIGIMKAIGARRGQIIGSYLIAVLIYSLVGTTLGIVLGIFGGLAFANYIANLVVLDLGPITLSPGTLALSILCGLGTPLLASITPLRQGTRITVREAMSAYGISAGQPRQSGLGWLPPTILLGWRSVWRRRARALLTLAALACAGAAFLAVQTTTVSLDRTLHDLFAAYDADVFVRIQPAPQATVMAQLSTIPNIQRVEPFISDGLETPWGLTIVRGLDPATKIYRYQLTHGNWLTPGESGDVVVSDLFMGHSHLHVGDVLNLSTATNQQTYRIVGVVHDNNGGSGSIGSVFVSTSDLIALNQLPKGYIDGYVLQAQDRSQPAINLLATHLDTTLSAQGLAPTVETSQQELQRNQQQFQILYLILYGVVLLIALVGMLGLANTLTTSVLERRREIGILRALGATGPRVASVFLTEGISLGLTAWLVAIAVGIPGAMGFIALLDQVLLPIQFTFAPLTLVIMLIFMLVVATLASMTPALAAARTRVAAILRYE